nr:hypothetical protein [Moritella viscosa]SHO03625.1 Membrane protein [Moritella viscosa]
MQEQTLETLLANDTPISKIAKALDTTIPQIKKRILKLQDDEADLYGEFNHVTIQQVPNGLTLDLGMLGCLSWHGKIDAVGFQNGGDNLGYYIPDISAFIIELYKLVPSIIGDSFNDTFKMKVCKPFLITIKDNEICKFTTMQYFTQDHPRIKYKSLKDVMKCDTYESY